jgi:hypothetical protein
VRLLLANKDVNMEAEEAVALKAITNWKLVKTQQAEKSSACAVVNCRFNFQFSINNATIYFSIHICFRY